MPPVTRWFIKFGMMWFVLGVTLAFVSELPARLGTFAAGLLAHAGHWLDYTDDHGGVGMDVSTEETES